MQGACERRISEKKNSLSFQYRAAKFWLPWVLCLYKPVFNLTFPPKQVAAYNWQKWIVKWWIRHAISLCFGAGKMAIFPSYLFPCVLAHFHGHTSLYVSNHLLLFPSTDCLQRGPWTCLFGEGCFVFNLST